MSAEGVHIPKIKWAQRYNCVFITIELSDVKDEVLNITPSSFEFKGNIKGENPVKYAVKFDFFADVDPEKKTRSGGDRVIGLCIEKKEPANWPSLLKDKSKPCWLKTDFEKWKDLDGSDSEDDIPGLGDYGGLGGGDGNLEQMLSMMNNKGMDDLDDDDGNDADSDDDDLPDLEESDKVADDKEKEETKA